MYSPHWQVCENRRDCAIHLLEADEEFVDDTSMKFRQVFRSELIIAAKTGQIPRMLWDLIVQLGKAWVPDTQALEGKNNQFKGMGKRCPWISWKLISSRMTVTLLSFSIVFDCT